MPWIESHQKLERHPKLMELCSKTGWSKDEAIGKLHRLWWWVLDFAEDGDLSKFSAAQIFGEIRGEISAETLLQIFTNTNFIDSDIKIHDWYDYAGNYLYAKYHNSNPKKLKKIQNKYKDNQRINKGHKKEAIPNLPNLPNQHNLNKDICPSLEEVISYCKERKNNVDPERWYNFYQAKGWLIGKNKIKDWKAAVRTWEKKQVVENKTPDKRPVRLQVIEMRALKIPDNEIKSSLLSDNYTESEIDSAMGRL